MTALIKRRRTTVWETADGKTFTDREAAFKHEKCLRIARFLQTSERYFAEHAAAAWDTAQALCDNREGFLIVLTQPAEGRRTESETPK